MLEKHIMTFLSREYSIQRAKSAVFYFSVAKEKAAQLGEMDASGKSWEANG